MSEPTKAVFLSYASQDAEAAKRICDALRVAGVEVWFDAEGGLEHGDEWDAKIRRQIKECVLFLPVISANTQAREEGYFRIEWELAAQRALGIASGVAFILPIVIDDTREPDALVPDRFRSVQWTRLRGGELTPEVKARFLKLWSHRTGALRHQSGVGASLDDALGRAQGTPLHSKPSWKAYAGLAAAVFALVATAGWWLLRREAPVVAGPPAPPAPVIVAGPSPAPPVSEARQLMEKARALYINRLDTSRDDCALAEDLLKQAQGKEANDPEVWASLSQLHSYVFLRGWDLSNQRREAARVAAQRAMRLDPASFEGRLAEAFLLADTGPEALEKERLLRALRTERPAEKRLLRALGSVLDRRGELAEADALSDEAAALPGGDPLSLYNKSLRHWFAGNTGRAEAAMAAALEQAPSFTGALIFTAWYAAHLHGDLERARATINRVPAGEMREDRPAFFAYFIELLGRQPDAAIARLQAVPRAWIEDNWYRGPKALLVGDTLQAGGRPAAAAIEWRSALQQLEEKLSQTPSNQRVLILRAMVLAKLGERAEAEKQFKALVERTGVSLTGDAPVPTWLTDLLILLGRHEEAIPQISRALRRERRAVEYTAATLRLDPKFDPVRAWPEFARVIAEAEAIEQTAAVAGQAPRVWPQHPDLKKAIDLIEGTESIPDDFALAEQIVQPIVDRAPTDLEAVTVMARVQSQFMRRGFDRSDERSARARLYGERALQLEPNEPEAMLAVATYLYSRVTGEARAERLLRRAMELDPANPRHGRVLADLLNVQPGRQAEALAQSQENVRRFPQDALTRYDLARHYKDQGRYEEFDRELDAVLALTLLPNAVAWKARLQFGLHNDFPGMKRWLDQVPERVRGTERTVFGYFLYAAFGGDTETGLEALRAFTQKWFTDFEYAGPTALLNADLLVRQGKTELARQQYEAAWLDIQRMRTTEPARIWLNQAEFWTLLGLGRKEEARQAFRRLVEAQRRPYAQSLFTGWWFTLIPGALLIGERDTALEFLRESVATLPEGRGAIRVRMQLDPRMAPFRDDPEIKALLADPGSVSAASTPKIDDKSVAVLAFANLSSDKEQEYFSDGISEELLNVLAKVPGLKVTARTSSFFFKGKDTPIPEIAQKLGVAYVVEGSVRKAGDKVRITAQLIKAADGFHVWSETFTRDLKDIFAVQDEIAGLIAQNFKVNVGLASPAARRAVNPEAHRLLLEGRHFWNLRTMEDFDRAEAALSQAIELDPDFVQAHAALADVRWVRTVFKTYSGFNYVPGTYVGKETARAQALDPMLAEAYPAAGAQLHWNGRAEEAGQLFRKAITLNPNYALAHHWYSLVLEGQGRLDEALAEIERALDLDPLSLAALSTRVRYLFAAGRVAEALSAYDKVLALRKNYFFSIGVYAQALLATGRREEALAVARSICARESMEVRYVGDAQAVFVLRALGHEAEAVAHVERLLPRLPADSYLQGVALASVDRLDEAIPYLERTPPGLTEIFYWNKTWDRWRDDPRFLRLLAKLNCTEEYKVARAILARMQLAAAKK